MGRSAAVRDMAEGLLFALAVAVFRAALVARALRLFVVGRVVRLRARAALPADAKRPRHLLVLLSAPRDSKFAVARTVDAAMLAVQCAADVDHCAWLSIQLVGDGCARDAAQAIADAVGAPRAQQRRTDRAAALCTAVHWALSHAYSALFFFLLPTRHVQIGKARAKPDSPARPVHLYVNHTAIGIHEERADALHVNVLSESQRLHFAAVVAQLRTAGVPDVDAARLGAHVSPAPPYDLVVDATSPEPVAWLWDAADGPRLRDTLAWHMGFAEIFRPHAALLPCGAAVDAALLDEALRAYASCGQRWGA